MGGVDVGDDEYISSGVTGDSGGDEPGENDIRDMCYFLLCMLSDVG